MTHASASQSGEPRLGRTTGPVSIAYEFDGEGQTVVCLHGVGGDGRLWRPQIAAWRSAFRVVAWDARGYHRSEAGPGPPTLDLLADDLARLLDGLDVESAHVVGHSMGGLVAQHAYARFPGRFSSLVLANTTRSLRASMTDAEVEAFLRLRLEPLSQGRTPADISREVCAHLLGPTAGPAARAAVVTAFSSLEADQYAAALRMVTQYAPVLDLAGVAVPTLVVCGGLDRITPPAAGLEIARAIRGSAYLELEGAGHMSNLERAADFSRAVAAFLQGVGDQSP